VARDSTARLLDRLDGRRMILTPDAPVTALPEGRGIEAAHHADGTIEITYRARETPAESVLEAVRAAGIKIRDLRIEQADLQDVFLDLTRSRAG
jgi:ABC-2 type transport system ATP-binding protein